jgi:hypothetical protein
MTAFVPVPNYDVAQLKGSTLILVNKEREREKKCIKLIYAKTSPLYRLVMYLNLFRI